MFDHDVDQSVLLLVMPLLALFAFPFVMAWMEESLDHDQLRPARAWTAVSTACAEAWSRIRSGGSHR